MCCLRTSTLSAVGAMSSNFSRVPGMLKMGAVRDDGGTAKIREWMRYPVVVGLTPQDPDS